tara:strand:- start:460 stop:714 length:255 start_codon:yes stop_codon:yes gene_type:complete
VPFVLFIEDIMKTRIVISHPNGEQVELEAEKFVLAFKEDAETPLNFHVKMLTDEILATSVRLSHLALKNEESLFKATNSQEKLG